MAAVVPARTDRWGCKLAAAALVLAAMWAPRSADAQSPKLEAAYVVLGSQGAVARAVLAQASSCPEIAVDGAQQPMNVRAAARRHFPVLVCERTIPAGATSASLENSPLPLPKARLEVDRRFRRRRLPPQVREDGSEGGRHRRGRRGGQIAGLQQSWPRASRTPSPTSSFTSATTSAVTIGNTREFGEFPQTQHLYPRSCKPIHGPGGREGSAAHTASPRARLPTASCGLPYGCMLSMRGGGYLILGLAVLLGGWASGRAVAVYSGTARGSVCHGLAAVAAAAGVRRSLRGRANHHRCSAGRDPLQMPQPPEHCLRLLGPVQPRLLHGVYPERRTGAGSGGGHTSARALRTAAAGSTLQPEAPGVKMEIDRGIAVKRALSNPVCQTEPKPEACP